jgi:hypothetical protein
MLLSIGEFTLHALRRAPYTPIILSACLLRTLYFHKYVDGKSPVIANNYLLFRPHTSLSISLGGAEVAWRLEAEIGFAKQELKLLT